MRIALVAYIENQAILGRVEYIMDGRNQLDGSETRGQMATGLGNLIQDFGTDFPRHLLDLIPGQAA
jgi:hypothetical protein